MNTQEAFDAAVEHLRKQGKRSQAKYSTDCLYRGPGGLKCAVGALIPDEIYRKSFEGVGIRPLINGFADLNSLFKAVNITLLEQLQHIHDQSLVENWEKLFERLAEFHELTMPSKGE